MRTLFPYTTLFRSPVRLVVSMHCRVLTGIVVLAEQFRAASFHLAPDRSTSSVVRVVCRVVPAGAAIAHRGGALLAQGRWTRILCRGGIDADRPSQSVD